MLYYLSKVEGPEHVAAWEELSAERGWSRAGVRLVFQSEGWILIEEGGPRRLGDGEKFTAGGVTFELVPGLDEGGHPAPGRLDAMEPGEVPSPRQRLAVVLAFLHHVAIDRPTPSLHAAWNRDPARRRLSDRGRVAQELEEAFNGATVAVSRGLAALPDAWKHEIADAIRKLARRNKRKPSAPFLASLGEAAETPPLPVSVGPAPANEEQTSSSAAAADRAVAIARLPRTAAEIFGREQDVAWLDACWNEGAHVASIVAFGGVGKSTLVWSWLRGMQKDCWRGAARIYGWSFYSQGTTDRVTSADEMVDEALRWFGDPDPRSGSPWDKGERLAALVRKQRTLLVLDGIEPLQWGPGLQEGLLKDPALSALLRELGAENQGLCVISSRFRLRDLEDFGGEKCRRLDLARLSATAGASLLRARGAVGTEHDLRAAADEYGGHALALALLGSYLEEAYEGDIAKRHEVGPLAGDPRFGGHARRVMAAYERMFQGGPEIAILRMLGLFDRPASKEELGVLRRPPAIAGVTDVLSGIGERGWNSALARLQRVCLLTADHDKRTDVHPLAREHFGAELQRIAPDAWREGHRRLYEHLTRTAPDLPATIDEMSPLYAAVVHGCQAGRRQEVFTNVYHRRINRGMEWFNQSVLGAHSSEAAALAAFFDPPWEELAPGLDAPSQVFVLNAAGVVLRVLGRLPEAARLIQAGLDRLLDAQQWRNSSISASNLSELFEAAGELEKASTYAERSIEYADSSGDAFMRMTCLGRLAATLHQMGRRAEAAARFDDAGRILKATFPAHVHLYAFPGVRVTGGSAAQAEDGLPELLYLHSGFRYCDLLIDEGRDAEVMTRAVEVLPWCVAQDRILIVALEHLSLGRAHLLAARRSTGGALAQAAEHLKHAVEGLRRAGHQDHLARGLLARAEVHDLAGDTTRVRDDLEEVLAIAARCGYRLHETDAHLHRARLHLAEGDRAAARGVLLRARALIGATGYHRRDADLAQLDTAVA